MWVVSALVCAVCYAAQGAWAKHLLRQSDEVAARRRVVFAIFAGAIPIMMLPLWWQGIPELQPHYWRTLFLSLGLNLLAFSLYVRAIAQGDLSLVAPVVGTTPVFMFFTSWWILGEVPSAQGSLGVVLVVVGVLVLEPRFWRGAGLPSAWAVAFLWSVTANLDKVAVGQSSAAWYGTTFHLLFAICYLPRLWQSERWPPSGSRPSLQWLVPLGVLQGLMLLAQFHALELTNAQYVIAVKRSGAVFSVLAGILLFREGPLGRRLLAALLIVAGAGLVLTG